MPKVVGICGLIGSGKNTVAEFLTDRHYTAMALADPIKIVLQDLFTIPTEILWGPSEKRTGEVRRMLQMFGTDFAREFDEDVWVKKLLYRITSWFNTGEDPYSLCYLDINNPRKDVVVTDVRFPNEAAALVRNFDARIIRVERPHLPDSEARHHASETEQKNIPAEYISATICNDGSPAELWQKVDSVVKELGL